MDFRFLNLPHPLVRLLPADTPLAGLLESGPRAGGAVILVTGPGEALLGLARAADLRGSGLPGAARLADLRLRQVVELPRLATLGELDLALSGPAVEAVVLREGGTLLAMLTRNEPATGAATLHRWTRRAVSAAPA